MFLGLDLGTSGVKALLIDGDQRVVASANASIEVSRPHPGWSEQDPADWVEATRVALLSLRDSHPAEIGAVRGIGLSGQMHGATLIDAAGNVLRPAILWNDTRSHREAALLDADPQFRHLTGNIVFPGFTAPKLLWVRDNEAGVFAATAKILLPKDYLRFWLTGEFISEMSDAAGTAWLDVARRDWSDTLLATCGLDRSHMPALVGGTAPAGRLRSDLAAELGLPAGIIVAGGAGDNAASACGMGTVASGSAFLSLGTSGVLFAATDSYRPNAESAVHTFCHALPNTWHQMGVILSATDAMNWLSSVVGVKPAELTGAVGGELQPPSSLLFLPYLSGERTPHNDAAIRGAFLGLGHESDRGAMTRAVMEGVAYAFRDSRDALEAAGTKLDRVTAIGGGSRSDYWLTVIATVLGIPVDLPADGDFGAAFGAARLGLIAAEGADPVSICLAPAIARTIEPVAGLQSAFEKGFARYRKAYPAIKGVFQ
ncbi:xylulokinase [Rhizobium sp. EC-SD404]|uniref:xylulokinase n=1 Tax=Rhizobium sp. EC-SD404 TaxID=2038389 RepID=UPI0012563ADE|nr:xylulokinase [Rhizobium sp. EC-SD404]VVT05436.1 xylulokinase [Rhizobium sp. EC-SD404]